MKFDSSKRDALDQEHLENPKPGDYWHEMFVPICMVVSVTTKYIVLLEERIQFPETNSWTWDVSKLSVDTREHWMTRLRYGSESLKNKTWCSVVPESHTEFLEEITNVQISSAIAEYMEQVRLLCERERRQRFKVFRIKRPKVDERKVLNEIRGQ